MTRTFKSNCIYGEILKNHCTGLGEGKNSENTSKDLKFTPQVYPQHRRSLQHSVKTKQKENPGEWERI